jgi:hypothetical protein
MLLARWWLRGRSWEELCFERGPQGWIFLAPNPWGFGRRRRYVVSEAQKANIVASLGHLSARHIVASVVLGAFFVGALALALWLVPTSWNAALPTILLVSIIGGNLVAGYMWLVVLRPLLAGARRAVN